MSDLGMSLEAQCNELAAKLNSLLREKVKRLRSVAKVHREEAVRAVVDSELRKVLFMDSHILLEDLAPHINIFGWKQEWYWNGNTVSFTIPFEGGFVGNFSLDCRKEFSYGV